MGDFLEDFVQRNRDQFDDDFNEAKVWSRINGNLDRSGNERRNIWWRVAAVLFLMSTLLLVWDKLDQPADRVAEVSQMDEFEMAEQYYSQLISEKKKLITSSGLKDYTNEFLEDLEKLDKLYGELKSNLKSQGNQQPIIDAMVNNLQLRLEILNRQIEILERLQSYEDEEQLTAI